MKKQKQIINNMEDFEFFIDDNSDEILSKVKGQSDGWNQKMTAINKILKRDKIEISDNVWNKNKTERLINEI